MAELYDVDVRTINYHIVSIFGDSELEEGATIRKFRIVQSEGSRKVNREINHYNLQMIIAVGFKVNNEGAIQFRKWANAISSKSGRRAAPRSAPLTLTPSPLWQIGRLSLSLSRNRESSRQRPPPTLSASTPAPPLAALLAVAELSRLMIL